jgi:hypothetical protein
MVTFVTPSLGRHFLKFAMFVVLHKTDAWYRWKRTLHLAGLWIGAAISNTSHSNKSGSTIAKRARLTRKESKFTAVLSH